MKRFDAIQMEDNFKANLYVFPKKNRAYDAPAEFYTSIIDIKGVAKVDDNTYTFGLGH